MVNADIFFLCDCFNPSKMAESIREGLLNNSLSNRENVSVDCAVCLQTCVHPAELPCGHIFCYLCIKGIVNQGRRCAMCRQEIPVDYLDKPRLLKPMDTEITSQGFEDGHLWFYEGHNGWWQYDERTSQELESAYQKGERSCDLLIAGFLYVADFDSMLQYRKSDPSRRRRIKRDLATTTKKGIAGLKATKNCNLTSSISSEAVSTEIRHDFPASNPLTSGTISGIRIFTSSLNNSNQTSEPVQGSQNSSRISGLSTCRPTNTVSSNISSTTNGSAPYPRNFNLDNVIHDTLDWTIEQIESLNLELLNEYEALFRDFNNYGQRQDNLNQNRRRRSTNNYMSRYLNISNPPTETFENESSSTEILSDLPNLGVDVTNPSREASTFASVESDPIYSEVSEIQSDRSSLQVNDTSPPPLPPPRNRGMSAARLRRDSSLHSLNSDCENLFQKFISNK